VGEVGTASVPISVIEELRAVATVAGAPDRRRTGAPSVPDGVVRLGGRRRTVDVVAGRTEAKKLAAGVGRNHLASPLPTTAAPIQSWLGVGLGGKCRAPAHPEFQDNCPCPARGCGRGESQQWFPPCCNTKHARQCLKLGCVAGTYTRQTMMHLCFQGSHQTGRLDRPKPGR
jgi:hypothetical protein